MINSSPERLDRRGSNELHGSLFYLNNVEDLNARNQFLPNKPAVGFNQFGGSLGAPASDPVPTGAESASAASGSIDVMA